MTSDAYSAPRANMTAEEHRVTVWLCDWSDHVVLRIELARRVVLCGESHPTVAFEQVNAFGSSSPSQGEVRVFPDCQMPLLE